jgi:hypothetical protein
MHVNLLAKPLTQKIGSRWVVRSPPILPFQRLSPPSSSSIIIIIITTFSSTNAIAPGSRYLVTHACSVLGPSLLLCTIPSFWVDFLFYFSNVLFSREADAMFQDGWPSMNHSFPGIFSLGHHFFCDTVVLSRPVGVWCRLV